MNKYRVLSDAASTEHLRSMDEKAFREIYERYWAILSRHIQKMLKDKEIADQVVSRKTPYATRAIMRSKFYA